MELISLRGPTIVGGPADRTLKQWQSLSIKTCWRLPQDWWLSEVEVVARTGRSVEALVFAARSLGNARYRQGIGMAEALGDFYCFFQAAHRSLNFAAVQAFAEGWAEGSESGQSLICTDPVTGLSSLSHFGSEIRRLASSTAAGSSVLGTVSLSKNSAAPLQPVMDWQQLAALGQICLEVFAPANATLTVRGHNIHAVAKKSPLFFAALLNCQAALTSTEEFADFRTHLDCEPVPADSEDVDRLLASISR